MKRILVVDDSLFVYEEIKRMLQDTEFQIAGYSNSGEKAVTDYEEIKPDLVTMDILLPGMDGLETTRTIVKKWPDAKVLVISSLAYEDTIAESECSGAKKFLYKPFDKEMLIEALEKTCADT